MADTFCDGRRSGRLTSVDVLRGLAALAVVLHHVPFNADDCPRWLAAVLSAPTRLGRLGVPLFLVLSGFCIHLGMARRLAAGQPVTPDWSGFWRRRIRRLYPPYLAAIALSLAVYAAAGATAYPAFERISDLPADLALHLLMVHNLFGAFCFGLGNGPFWSLGVEEQLYGLYAVYCLMRRKLPTARVVAVVFAVSLAWQVAWRFVLGLDDGAASTGEPFALGAWLRWPFGYWFSWVLGAWAAEGHGGATTLPAWCGRRSSMIGLAGVGLLCSPPVLELIDVRWLAGAAGCSDVAFSAAAFVLLNRCVRAEARGGFRGAGSRALAGVGVISYSLYLTHLPLVRLLGVLHPPGPGLIDWLGQLAIVFPVTLGAAAAFYHLVERRFLRRTA